MGGGEFQTSTYVLSLGQKTRSNGKNGFVGYTTATRIFAYIHENQGYEELKNQENMVLSIRGHSMGFHRSATLLETSSHDKMM